jgi:hypothetical protein
MKSTITLFAALLLTAITFAQTNVTMNIHHELQGISFNMDQEARNNMGHTFKVTRLDYYLTKFSIIHDGGQVTAVPEEIVALIRAQNAQIIDLGDFNVTSIEGVKFHVGVHTPVNHEDMSALPTSHPLGPKSPSMHWGWNAGYRFIAYEGNGGSSFSNTIQYHGLGDVNYHETTVMASAIDVSGSKQIEVYADYSRGFENIAVENGEIFHGETGNAAKLIRNFRDYVFTGESTATLTETQTETFNVYPVPSTGTVNVAWSNAINPEKIQLLDINGRVVQTLTPSKDNTSISFEVKEKGSYFLSYSTEYGKVISKKVIIQ